MDVQLMSAMFEPSHPKSILSFFRDFKTVWDGKWDLSKSEHMAVPKFHIGSCQSRSRTSCVRRGKRRSLKWRRADYILSGCELLFGHLRDRRRDNGSRDLIHNLQPAQTQGSCQIFWRLLKRALPCSCIYEKAPVKWVFIQGLHKSVRFSMRAYWGRIKTRHCVRQWIFNFQSSPFSTVPLHFLSPHMYRT